MTKRRWRYATAAGLVIGVYLFFPVFLAVRVTTNLIYGGFPNGTVLLVAAAITVPGALAGSWVVSIVRLTEDRRAAGECLKCGYDLRESTGRCPECGRRFRRE